MSVGYAKLMARLLQDSSGLLGHVTIWTKEFGKLFFSTCTQINKSVIKRHQMQSFMGVQNTKEKT